MELPVVVGLHVCERVTEDPVQGSFTLLNRSSILRAPEFPAALSFSIFGVFVNGFGMLAFRVEIEQLATGMVVHEFPSMVEFKDRLREIPYLVDLSEIVFWFPGEYDVSLTIEGEPTTKCKIHLIETGGAAS